jgi:transketolase
VSESSLDQLCVDTIRTLSMDAVGDDGDVVAMEGFGASAPAKELYALFGCTGESVAERARRVLDRVGRAEVPR